MNKAKACIICTKYAEGQLSVLRESEICMSCTKYDAGCNKPEWIQWKLVNLY